ncbi:MAG: PQQ-binding-like beta-propeller repeat protein, partial [Planctomycetaceae bacterium]|nr:PQQ-binding-like beta-propeller repeat protein [Planctomycetaceae bacterium]
LWRRELPATRSTDMASGFSDNTAASPVTDGQSVCFVNVGGSVQTYDLEGQLIWKQEWVPFGRHHARQQEPLLHDGKVIFLKTIAENLPVSATTKAGAKPFGRGEEYWTRLHAFDLDTGKRAWVAESATSVHSASLLNRTVDGTPAILTGRGGGHQPPEEPYGLSLINADTGKVIWDLPISGYAAHQNAVWRGDRGAAFVGMQHHMIDTQSGTLQPAVSLSENVSLRQHKNGRYVSTPNASLPSRKKKPITYHTNCFVGDFHYFRTHNDFFLGRVNVTTGKVEYLQVPAQVVRSSDTETLAWDRTLPNDVRNNDGFLVYQDKRATLSGWGHVSAASPIVVGDYLYMPTMVGVVYVIRWNAPQLDESALVSISDLGPAGKTWTLSSLAYSDGNLYARTLKELICIGE